MNNDHEMLWAHCLIHSKHLFNVSCKMEVNIALILICNGEWILAEVLESRIITNPANSHRMTKTQGDYTKT